MKNTKDVLEKIFAAGIGAKFALNEVKKNYSGQVGVLNVLIEEDEVIQSELSEILDVKPSSIAEFVKKLERAGLVERKTSEVDKRIKIVSITQEGREFVEKTNPMEKDVQSNYFHGLSQEEIETLKTLLEKLSDGWEVDLQDRISEHILHSPSERLRDFKEFREFGREIGRFEHHGVGFERRGFDPSHHRFTEREMLREARDKMRGKSLKEQREIRKELRENMKQQFKDALKEEHPSDSEWQDF